MKTLSLDRALWPDPGDELYPGYSEIDAIATGLALAHALLNATDSQSDLGARFDRIPAAVTSNGAVLAWAQNSVLASLRLANGITLLGKYSMASHSFTYAVTKIEGA